MQVLKSSFFRKFSPYFLKIPIFYAARWRQGGGKVPLPGAPANAPPGGCGGWYRRALVGLHDHLRGAQQARSAPRTNVRELFCGSKITRNDSDEAERRERSPSGVVSAANVEELAAAGGQVSGKAAPANGSASQVNGSSEASGEVRTGDRARRRRAGLEKALRSHPQTTGAQFVACNGMER